MGEWEDGDQGVDDSADPVATLVLLLLADTNDGRVPRSDLDRYIDEIGLSARLYRPALDAIADAGLKIIDDAPPDDAEDDIGGDEQGGWDADGLGVFIRQSRHEVLTVQEEIDLAQRMEVGCLAAEALAEAEARGEVDPGLRRDLTRRIRDGNCAADDLARHNIRLVISIAKRAKRQCTASMQFEDLIQEGYFGLARAVEMFDWRKGFKFSTYATWWIRQSISRAIADKSRTIRLPVHAHETAIKIYKLEQRLIAEGKPATPRVIARELEIQEDTVRDLLRYRAAPVSLDLRLRDGQSSLHELIADDRTSVAEAMVLDGEASAMVDKALAALSERERTVIRARFGLDDGNERTLEEVGRMFGVTRERIRQIQNKAMNKLRSPGGRQLFAGYDPRG
jgi:RNA polymerase sigma factor (sigma-70 family)